MYADLLGILCNICIASHANRAIWLIFFGCTLLKCRLCVFVLFHFHWAMAVTVVAARPLDQAHLHQLVWDYIDGTFVPGNKIAPTNMIHVFLRNRRTFK